jgi:hypothetical protein
MLFKFIDCLRRNRIVRKINKYVKITTLLTIITKIISYFPISITFRIIWILLKLSLFLIGASTVYLTSFFEDPSIPLNLFNQIFNNTFTETHIFVQNTLNKIINYLKSFLDDSDSNNIPKEINTKERIPEPKLESYFSINGYKFPIND